jgi:hypothetical protein
MSPEELRAWRTAIRLGDEGDVSNEGKEFKGVKEFELLTHREVQILHPFRV